MAEPPHKLWPDCDDTVEAWKMKQAKTRLAESKRERAEEAALQCMWDIADSFADDGMSVRILARRHGVGWRTVEDAIRMQIRFMARELGWASPEIDA